MFCKMEVVNYSWWINDVLAAFDHSQHLSSISVVLRATQTALLSRSRRGRVYLPTSLNPRVKRSLLHPDQEIQSPSSAGKCRPTHLHARLNTQTHANTLSHKVVHKGKNSVCSRHSSM